MLQQYFCTTLDDLSLAVETRLPFYRIAEGGMQVRLMGRISWECRQSGVVMNRLGIAYEEYQSARVIEPIPGYYGEDPVAVLDFASLVSFGTISFPILVPNPNLKTVP